MLKVSKGNAGTMCEICSQLTIKTLEWRTTLMACLDVFIFNFEQISHNVNVGRVTTNPRFDAIKIFGNEKSN